MLLGEFLQCIAELKATGQVTDESPLILEGWTPDEETFVQAMVDDVMSESRCEEEGQPQAVFVGMSDIEIES